MDYQDFDLFGNPVPANYKGRGRPPHTPSREKATIIMLLAAVGKSTAEMASALQITEPTLRKHYFSPKAPFRVRVPDARPRIKAALLYADFREAQKGSAAHITHLWSLLEKAEAREVEQAMARAQPTGDKLGKKEQAAADAPVAHVGTSWDRLLQ